MSLDDSSPQAPIPASLLDRYLAGEATPEERARVEQWRRHDPLYNGVADVLHTRGSRSDMRPDVASAWQQIRARALADAPRAADQVDSRAPGVLPAVPAGPNASPWRARAPWGTSGRRQASGSSRLWQVTGVGLCVLGLISVMWYGSSSTGSVSTHVYHTEAGQYSTLQLASGSHLSLGPATTVTVEEGLPNQATRVTVRGQVLCTVTSNAHTPFLVRAGHTLTRVLGTTFIVRKYETDRAVRVAVVEGRVAVSARVRQRSAHPSDRGDVRDTVLSARSLAVVTDSGIVQITSDLSADEVANFTNGQLVFRQTPVRDVIPELERAYNVTIRLSDSSLADHALTFTVPTRTRSVDDVLRALVPALDAHYSRSGRTILIQHGRSPGPPPSVPIVKETEYGR